MPPEPADTVDVTAPPWRPSRALVCSLAALLVQVAERRRGRARLAHVPQPGRPDLSHVVRDDTGFCDEADR